MAVYKFLSTNKILVLILIILILDHGQIWIMRIMRRLLLGNIKRCSVPSATTHVLYLVDIMSGGDFSSSAPAQEGRPSRENDPVRMQFWVTVPEGSRPDDTFRVVEGGREVGVRVPERWLPGRRLRIILSALRPHTGSLTRIPHGDLRPGERRAYSVEIPDSVRGDERQFTVTCPYLARPGMTLRIAPPDTQMFEVAVPRGVKPRELQPPGPWFGWWVEAEDDLPSGDD